MAFAHCESFHSVTMKTREFFQFLLPSYLFLSVRKIILRLCNAQLAAPGHQGPATFEVLLNASRFVDLPGPSFTKL